MNWAVILSLAVTTVNAVLMAILVWKLGKAKTESVAARAEVERSRIEVGGLTAQVNGLMARIEVLHEEWAQDRQRLTAALTASTEAHRNALDALRKVLPHVPPSIAGPLFLQQLYTGVAASGGDPASGTAPAAVPGELPAADGAAAAGDGGPGQ
jgi:hypothetical protein